jgi:hypothetical protein
MYRSPSVCGCPDHQFVHLKRTPGIICQEFRSMDVDFWWSRDPQAYPAASELDQLDSDPPVDNDFFVFLARKN